MSLGAGLSKVAGKLFRIGHLGVCNELTLMGALSGVEIGLALAGVPHTPGGANVAREYLTRTLNEARRPHLVPAE
jgi:alanine-glyoxylate transaminase/serine-glyoxylate transaminase/serine-pyruvate transaminase